MTNEFIGIVDFGIVDFGSIAYGSIAYDNALNIAAFSNAAEAAGPRPIARAPDRPSSTR